VTVTRSGAVIDFDEHIGLGHVRSTVGDEYLFHCTQIAGGSRVIDAGTRVQFTVRETHKGLVEAFDVTAT
jgi:cold shock CspA family protein